MNDVLRALGISAGILFFVVVLTVIITIAAVKRGEAGQAEAGHGAPDESLPVKEAAASPPAKAAAKPAAAASDEISVSQILLLGIGLFTATILALLLVSLITHLS